MSLANYSDLLAALDGADGYLHQTNLTAKIPTFIRLCESKFNSTLNLLQQEVEVTNQLATVGSRTIPLPSDFSEHLALWDSTYLPRRKMEYRSTVDIPVSASNSASQYFTIDGNNIATENPADKAYNYTFRYLQNFNLASTSTNVIMTNWPDLYVYGTCLASIASTRKTELIPLWQPLYDAAMKDAMKNTIGIKGQATLRYEFLPTRSRILYG